MHRLQKTLQNDFILLAASMQSPHFQELLRYKQRANSGQQPTYGHHLARDILPCPLSVIYPKHRIDIAVKAHVVTGGGKDQLDLWKGGSYKWAPSTRRIHPHKSLVAYFCKTLTKDGRSRLHESFWWYPSASRSFFYLQMQQSAWIYYRKCALACCA